MAKPDQLLAEEFTKQLSVTLEGMLGQSWTIEVKETVSSEQPSAEKELHIWGQRLTIHADPLFRVMVGPLCWKTIGASALRAAGIDEASDADILSTYVEILTQALSGVARAVGSQVGKEVGLAKGAEETTVPTKGKIVEIRAVDPEGVEVRLYFGVGEPLMRLLASGEQDRPQFASAVPVERESEPRADKTRENQPSASSKMDLLMDVEMPVSVSFGRAQLPLKEVIKLTTGSIVELNRNVSEPVEVIVNNCVIARGEVVVVEGNYGIRIHQIVSRAERIRSLD